MQKKCLLFMVAFSCIAQVIVADDENITSKDLFVDLREDLRILRKNPDNALYADLMVNDAKAIEQALEKKKELIEKDRAARKKKISDARSWFFSESKGTLVYNEDKKVDDELNQYKEDHEKLAQAYKDFISVMNSDVSVRAKDELTGAVAVFKTMHKALSSCKLADQACYDKYGAPSYDKMANPKYRSVIQKHYHVVPLKYAHEKNIPITEDELKVIIDKNAEYKATIAEINALEDSIDDLLNPEKIKAREQKKIQDLEEQRKREEEAKKQALEQELKQKNAQQ
jgi:hypothetical protein